MDVATRDRVFLFGAVFEHGGAKVTLSRIESTALRLAVGVLVIPGRSEASLLARGKNEQVQRISGNVC